MLTVSAGSKFYTITAGRRVGVFGDWYAHDLPTHPRAELTSNTRNAASRYVNNVPNARHKSYHTFEKAYSAYKYSFDLGLVEYL